MRKILHIKHLIALILIEILVLILIRSRLEIDDSFLPSLVSVTGILTGIIIAFLTSIFFNEKKNREKIKNRFDELSIKLTTYRRLLYNVIITADFWIEYKKIREFRQKFSNIRFSDLHNDDMIQEIKDFWLNGEYPTSGTDLYLAMLEIYGSDGVEYWLSDEKVKIDYSIDDLRKYIIPSNQIWYYLEGRYKKFGEGHFDDTKFPHYRTHQIQGYATNISENFKERDVDRILLADLGTMFHAEVLPEMIDLANQLKSVIPKSVSRLLFFLTMLLIFGCIIPLFLMAFRFEFETYYIVTVLIMFTLGLYYSVVSLFDIMNNELK